MRKLILKKSPMERIGTYSNVQELHVFVACLFTKHGRVCTERIGTYRNKHHFEELAVRRAQNV